MHNWWWHPQHQQKFICKLQAEHILLTSAPSRSLGSSSLTRQVGSPAPRWCISCSHFCFLPSNSADLSHRWPLHALFSWAFQHCQPICKRESMFRNWLLALLSAQQLTIAAAMHPTCLSGWPWCADWPAIATFSHTAAFWLRKTGWTPMKLQAPAVLSTIFAALQMDLQWSKSFAAECCPSWCVEACLVKSQADSDAISKLHQNSFSSSKMEWHTLLEGCVLCKAEGRNLDSSAGLSSNKSGTSLKQFQLAGIGNHLVLQH